MYFWITLLLASLAGVAGYWSAPQTVVVQTTEPSEADLRRLKAELRAEEAAEAARAKLVRELIGKEISGVSMSDTQFHIDFSWQETKGVLVYLRVSAYVGPDGVARLYYEPRY